MNRLSFLVLLALPGLAGAQSFDRDLSSGPERPPIVAPEGGRIADGFSITETTSARGLILYATQQPYLGRFQIRRDVNGTMGSVILEGGYRSITDLGPVAGSAYFLRRWEFRTDGFGLIPGNYFLTVPVEIGATRFGRVGAVDDALLTSTTTTSAFNSVSGGDWMFGLIPPPVPEPASLLVLSLGLAFRKGRRRG